MRYAAAAVLCLLALGAAYQPKTADVGIGIVDVATVLTRYAKWQDMQKVLEERRGRRAEELDALAAEVDALRKELAKLDPDAKAYLEKQGALIQKEALLETTSQQYEIELGVSEEKQYEALIDEVGAAVAEIARERGLAVVLQRALEAPDGVWESVLYAEPRADLTDALIAYLNQKYAERK
jgi:Skp family chaperone for outer membrane proteins